MNKEITKQIEFHSHQKLKESDSVTISLNFKRLKSNRAGNLFLLTLYRAFLSAVRVTQISTVRLLFVGFTCPYKMAPTTLKLYSPEVHTVV